MVWWKVWFDLRRRFYLAAGVMAILAGMVPAFYPYIRHTLEQVVREAPDTPFISRERLVQELHRMVGDFRYYIDTQWFGKNGAQSAAFFGLLLALGGVMTEGGHRSLQLTLSLPATRRRWLMAQAGMVLGMLAVLILGTTLIVEAGSRLFGSSYPWGRALRNSMALFLGALPGVGLTFLATSITGEKIKAGIGAGAILVISGVLSLWAPIRSWTPWHVMYPLAWDAGIPWKAAALSTAVGIGGFVWAVRRFEHADL